MHIGNASSPTTVPSQSIMVHQPPQGPDPESGNHENAAQETQTTSEDPASVTGTQRLKTFFRERSNLSNFLACTFVWIVHAGFLILPTSFPKALLEVIYEPSCSLVSGVQSTRNIEFLSLGIVCCVVGGIGLLCLGLCHSDNYTWLRESIFIPGALSGVSGLISTFVNIYGSVQRNYRVFYGGTTTTSLVVTGGCTVICGSLTVLYMVLKNPPNTSP